MNKNYKLEQLLLGETIITNEKGNSMTPLIHSGQNHELTPIQLLTSPIEVGDIVYCKVKGKYYTHIVKAISPNKGYLIGNNKGGVNGWTKSVYGKVTQIF